MNEPVYMDSEYESIRDVMKSRGHNAGQLPRKTVAFIPEDRADRVLALDQRIQSLQKATPFIVGGMILLAFLIGLAL